MKALAKLDPKSGLPNSKMELFTCLLLNRPCFDFEYNWSSFYLYYFIIYCVTVTIAAIEKPIVTLLWDFKNYKQLC